MIDRGLKQTWKYADDGGKDARSENKKIVDGQ